MAHRPKADRLLDSVLKVVQRDIKRLQQRSLEPDGLSNVEAHKATRYAQVLDQILKTKESNTEKEIKALQKLSTEELIDELVKERKRKDGYVHNGRKKGTVATKSGEFRLPGELSDEEIQSEGLEPYGSSDIGSDPSPAK